jgi:ribosomal protein S18 acetylase RimI-like enzyme
MPDLFSRPYLRREPELAHVVEARGGVVGYVLGTADTPGFARWYREVWLPALAQRYSVAADVDREALLSPGERLMLSLHRTPERMLLPELAHLPAHLHIDLLPEFQGRGWGRRLIAAFLAGLTERGVDGVHLGMVTTNTRARAFYDRLGFVEVPVADAAEQGVTYLQRSTRG